MWLHNTNYKTALVSWMNITWLKKIAVWENHSHLWTIYSPQMIVLERESQLAYSARRKKKHASTECTVYANSAIQTVKHLSPCWLCDCIYYNKNAMQVDRSADDTFPLKFISNWRSYYLQLVLYCSLWTLIFLKLALVNLTKILPKGLWNKATTTTTCPKRSMKIYWSGSRELKTQFVEIMSSDFL